MCFAEPVCWKFIFITPSLEYMYMDLRDSMVIFFYKNGTVH